MLLLYISPLLIGGVLGIFLALYILRSRLTASNRALLALVLGAWVWSLGYALEFLCPAFECKLFWAKFQYFGIGTIPLAWLVYAFRYLGSTRMIQPPFRFRSLLALPAILTVGLVWTNELHHLIWREVNLRAYRTIQIMEFEHGPAFWVYLVFSYALLLIGSARLVSGLLGSVRLHRWQSGMALAAVLIPWIGNLVYITGYNPVPHLDWTPFAFTIAGLLFTVSLFRYGLIDILPIAQQVVFAGLPDCLLVLDAQDALVEINQSAQRMFGQAGQIRLGEPLARVSPELAHWVEQARFDEECRAEITHGEAPDQRFFELRITPLHGPYPQPVGRLVVCHEITQHKQQQALLEQAVAERTGELNQAVEQLRELASRLQAVQEMERRRLASELHDRVGQNLTALSLNLQIIQNQMAGEPNPEARRRLADSLKLVEETTRMVRNVLADLQPPMLDEHGLLAALRWYGGIFSQRAGIPARVVGEESTPRLPHTVETILFRLAQEALNNVAKHARASQVEISLTCAGDAATLTVKDDGQGFDPQALKAPGELPRWGLLTMQQRAASIGAELFVDTAPGQGTTIIIRMPGGRDAN